MIYFVGAGCGAADLITVRGMRLIEDADVLIYAGSLVNPELLQYARKDCAIYNSAKMTLEEVIDVMVRADADGHTVVRLHTGEPSIYGAVQEQMRALDAKEVAYESCPGVSACFGAAASLNLEFTQPDVSQSLIITRMEGRTSVPTKEQIELLASHRTSMAIYLSTGMLEELSRRLIEGGYSPDTPAAIVYKASWPDEQKYRCTVATLPTIAAEHNIRNLAVILVGDALGKTGYADSRLYAPDFETAFRKASHNVPSTHDAVQSVPPTRVGKRILRVATFTDSGKKVVERISHHLKNYILEYRDSDEPLPQWVEDSFRLRQPILFVSATGIVVRAIAPYVVDKFSDSPVIVADDQANNVISLLSGHMGGANELTKEIASILSAHAVITTATDVNGKFSIDDFARRNGLRILNRESMPELAQRILRGEQLRVCCDADATFEGTMPSELAWSEEDMAFHEAAIVGSCAMASSDVDVEINSGDFRNPKALHLRPKNLVIGMGCKKNTSFKNLYVFLQDLLQSNHLEVADVAAIATVDIKAEERGFIQLAQYLRVPLHLYSAEQLQAVPGKFPESNFVKNTVGVGNVCQRAAVLESGEAGTLLVEKVAKNGMTAAIAKRRSWNFEW
jgi:precorrin-4 C11-methyltransferase